jgi:hypothetical protein
MHIVEEDFVYMGAFKCSIMVALIAVGGKIT